MKDRNLAQKVIFKFKETILKRNFSSNKYWNLRYDTGGNSGFGSYGKYADNKADFINDVVSKYDLSSVIEFGCGDGNQLEYYNFENYLGLDVASKAVELCHKKYKADVSKSFIHINPFSFNNNGSILNADLILSSEVIFHLVEEDVYEKHMHDLFKTAKNYVLIISTNKNHNPKEQSHIVSRPFHKFIEKHYSNWCFVEDFKSDKEEVNEQYGKYFHLFKRA
jgi:cyclopropane fatty-acyl-phospholipid synthase-like methyltransferase